MHCIKFASNTFPLKGPEKNSFANSGSLILLVKNCTGVIIVRKHLLVVATLKSKLSNVILVTNNTSI